MRDPKRIPVMLDLLRAIWAQDPDMRLCQLISGIASRKGYISDLFYVEDNKMIEAMNIWLHPELENKIRVEVELNELEARALKGILNAQLGGEVLSKVDRAMLDKVDQAIRKAT